MNFEGIIQLTWFLRKYQKYWLCHPPLTGPLGQNTKQKAVLHFVLRVLGSGYGCWLGLAIFQVNWMVPNFEPGHQSQKVGFW
jgi:hypothetical protein